MKGLYIAAIDNKIYPWSIGVSNKINGQINAFKSLGIDMDYLRSNNASLKLNEEFIESNKITRRFGFTIFAVNFFNSILKSHKYRLLEYDFIYIRYAFANPSFLKVIKFLKKNNKKVFVEIPTYPYEDEFKKSLLGIVMKSIDKVILKKIARYVESFIMTNDLKSLYGAKTINIFNGISEINTDYTINKSKDVVNMIAIANLSPWHGYDRIINGLKEYYKKENDIIVNLFIVGDGVEKENLVNLVSEYNLQDNVKFLGIKRGNELDEIFKNSHIGVSSLALFRAGGGHDPIKSKEYVGRGIPVILGYNDRALNKDLPFVFSVPANESIVDISDILQKYNQLDLSQEDIQMFAQCNLTWKTQMSKIVEEVLEK